MGGIALGGISENTIDAEFKARYTELINNIDLKAIDLLELNCIQYPKTSKSYGENKSNNVDEINVSANSNFSGYDIKNNDLVCFPTFTLQSKNGEDDIFSIKIKYSVIYELNLDLNSVEDSVIEKFLEKNLPINIWPYMRELVSSLTVKMGYPSLVLPVYKSTGM